MKIDPDELSLALAIARGAEKHELGAPPLCRALLAIFERLQVLEDERRIPREPTERMLRAGVDAYRDHKRSGEQQWLVPTWYAMYDAATDASSEPEQKPAN